MIDPKKREQLAGLLGELDRASLEDLAAEFLTVARQLPAGMTTTPAPFPPEDLPVPEPPSKIVGLDGKPINQPKHIERAAANADPSLGLLEVKVQGNGQLVQIEFDRTLKVVTMPTAQAFQFACLILENCGAKIDKAVIPSPPSTAPSA